MSSLVKTSEARHNEGRWTKSEHQAFLKGLALFGKEWKRIAVLIPTRSIVQVRTHAQKYFQKVARVRFEKQGKKVPEALRSTAIKGNYNFDALQVALNAEKDNSPLIEQQQSRKIRHRKTGTNGKSNANQNQSYRRSRRKGSKSSNLLKKLTDSNNIIDNGDMTSRAYDYDFGPISVDKSFDFSARPISPVNGYTTQESCFPNLNFECEDVFNAAFDEIEVHPYPLDNIFSPQSNGEFHLEKLEFDICA